MLERNNFRGFRLRLAGLIIGIFFFGNFSLVAQETKDITIDSVTQKRVVEQLEKDLMDNYVFPDLAKKMSADKVSRINQGVYKDSTSAFR